MFLSKQARREMLEDGLSAKRQKAFLSISDDHLRMSLDEYVRFLMQAQHIFGPLPCFARKTNRKI